MTPEGQKLEGTLAHQIADAVWYCTHRVCDLYKPTPPLSLLHIIAGVRDFNVQFRRNHVAKRMQLRRREKLFRVALLRLRERRSQSRFVPAPISPI